MRKFIVGSVLVIGFILVGYMRADAVGAPPTKVGYVDLQRTLNETKVGKAARARLEKEKATRQKDLDKAQGDLKAQFDSLEKQRAVLKPDVLAKKERDLQEQYMKLQQDFVKAQQELTQQEAQLTRDIFKKASGIIESIAKREGYTIMLEKNESAVLYADPSGDITDEVNKRVDLGK